MELSECSCIGLSKVRRTGRKLFPCLVVMAYTSPIPVQGKVVLIFTLTLPGGFLNPDIVPLNICQRLASPLFCFSYVLRRDGTARVSVASSVLRWWEKGPQGEILPPIAKGVVAEGGAAAVTYKTRCYQRAAGCHFEKGHSLAFECWYGLVPRREKIDLKGDNTERRRRIICTPSLYTVWAL